MKKATALLTAFFLAGALIVFYGQSAGFGGKWLDRVVSGVFFRISGHKAVFENCRWVGWSKLEFASFRLEELYGCSIRAQKGRAVIMHWNGQEQGWAIQLSDVRAEGKPLNAWARNLDPSNKLSGQLGYFDQVTLALFCEEGRVSLRSLRARSSLLFLFGGADITRSKLVRAHLTVLADGRLMAKIPDSLQKRLLGDARGWRGGRLTLNEGMVRFFGANSPLLEMTWQ